MSDPEVLGAELAHLYRAGKVFFPQQAAKFAQLDSEAAAQGPAVQSAADTTGNPAAFRQIMSLIDVLQKANQRTSNALEAIGHNLIKVAENFDWTDATIAAYHRELKAEQLDQVPTIPVPPAPSPYPYNPDGPKQEGD